MIVEELNNIPTNNTSYKPFVNNAGVYNEDYPNYFINPVRSNNQVIYGELLLLGQEGIRFQIPTLPCLIGRKEIYNATNSKIDTNNTNYLMYNSTVEMLKLSNIYTRYKVQLLDCKCM